MARSLIRHLPAVVLGLGLAFAPLLAAAESESIRIDYRAEASCPGADQFVGDVLRRAPRARIAAAGESGRTFVIVISRTDSGFEGSLAIQGDSSSTAARRVKGARCAEVAEVLALSTAIAVDPTAATGSHPLPASGSTTGTGPGESTTAEPPGAAAPGTSSTAESAAKKPRAEPELDARPEQRTEPETYEQGAGSTYDYASRPTGASVLIGPELHTGVGPSLARGLVLGIDAASPAPGAWLSSLGVEFGYLTLSTSRVGGAASSFELYVARPRLCGPALRASRISLAPCLSAELGLLSGSGSEIAFPESTNRFWAGAAAPLRLQVELSPTWLVEVAAAPVLAITRDQFVFQNPDTEIYEVPPLGFTGGLRLGARL